MTKAEANAFPLSSERESTEYGLSKREYFAAMAVQGLATMPELDNSLVAKHAVLIADALIEELNKQSK